MNVVGRVFHFFVEADLQVGLLPTLGRPKGRPLRQNEIL